MAGKAPADHPRRGMRDLAARMRLPLGGHRRQDLLGFPAARVVPVAMARNLPGAGLDKDAVRRRDKAGLVVSRHESKLYNYQKEFTSKYEQLKASTSKYEQLKASSQATEIMLKRELARQQSALAETRKSEENLKGNLAIEKEITSKYEQLEIMLKRQLASQQSALAETRKREENLKRNLAIQKEHISTAEIKRLRQEQEVALVRRRQEFDTEMETKLASFEEEIDARKALLDQRETAINEQEDAVTQREQNLNLRLAELANKEESLVKKSDELREEEKRLSSEREALQIELQKEKEEIRNLKLDLEMEKSFFEEKDGLKVGKKRLNSALSHGDSEILQPKQKQQKSTTQTVIGGEIDSNCPSVLEEKYSKNEHDAVPIGLCGKGPHNPQAGGLASSVDVLLVNGKSDASDVPEGDGHSKDNSVSAAESHEDSDDEGEEEKMSTAKKIWRFLIT